MQNALFEEPTFTVVELSTGIGVAIGRAFPDEVWVRGEIANISRASSGHVFFDLVGDGSSLAVTLWESDKQVVNGVLKRAGGVRMIDGTEVRIRARVTWYPAGGKVSLRMLSIDTAYTLGRLAEDRDRLLRALAAAGLLRRQAALRLPALPLRVGLVTSDGSAAAHDFLNTLENSGHTWQVVLADARVQGAAAEASLVAAIDALCRHQPALDVVCVVRGGGSRTDLVAFEREPVARAIATAALPILTGIGHEIDTTVADEVAHERHKTPTACAAALVERVSRWCDRLHRHWTAVTASAVTGLERADRRVARASGRVVADARQHLRASESVLEHVDARVRALDPVNVLARGWTITRDESGTLIKTAQVAPGTPLVTTFADGSVRSVVDG